MRIKKLSLAAAISIGMFSIGIPASIAADELNCDPGTPAGGAAQTTAIDESSTSPSVVTQPMTPAAVAEIKRLH